MAKKKKDCICGRMIWSSIFIIATDKSYSLGAHRHRYVCMLRDVALAKMKWKELSSIIPSTRARRAAKWNFFKSCQPSTMGLSIDWIQISVQSICRTKCSSTESFGFAGRPFKVYRIFFRLDFFGRALGGADAQMVYIMIVFKCRSVNLLLI